MWGINDRSSTPLARLGWLIQLLHKRPLSTTHSDSCLHSCRTNAISDQYHGPDHERCSVPGDGSPHHGSLIHNQAMDWPGDLHQPLKDDLLIHDCVMRCMTLSSQVDIPPPVGLDRSAVHPLSGGFLRYRAEATHLFGGTSVAASPQLIEDVRDH